MPMLTAVGSILLVLIRIKKFLFFLVVNVTV